MTPTDEQLATLLRDTFAAHESLADPAAAVRLATTVAPPPRRVWPGLVAVAAAVAIIAFLGAYVVRGAGSDEVSPPVTSPSGTATDEGNIELARQEVQRLLTLVPLPAGSERVEEAPTPGLAGSRFEPPGPADPFASRWWTVPLGVDDFESYVLANAPKGLVPTAGGRSAGADGSELHVIDLEGGGTAAFAQPTVRLEFQSLGTGTAVHATSIAMARFARTADTRIPGAVTAVGIDRTVRGGSKHADEGVRQPHVEITDPTLVQQLVDAVNALPGARQAEPTVGGIPGYSPAQLTLTFHTSGGDITVDEVDMFTLAKLVISRDGVALAPQLDAGDIATTVEQVVHHAEVFPATSSAAVSPTTGSTGPGVTATYTPPTGTDDGNYALAEQASEATLALAPLPDGAARLDDKPTGWPGNETVLGPSDGSLSREAWWSVPKPRDRVGAYLASHVPDGMGIEEGTNCGDSSGTCDISYVGDESADPQAYSTPYLLLQYGRIGDRTIVHAETFLLSRRVRTAKTFVSGTVTGVGIDRVTRGDGLTNTVLPHTEVTDASKVGALITAVNSLLGASPVGYSPSCPSGGSPALHLTLTFHTDDGELVVDGSAWCGGTFTVSRDGRDLEPRLDPGNLEDVVSGILD